MDEDGDGSPCNIFRQEKIHWHAFGIDTFEQIDLGLLRLAQSMAHFRHDPPQSTELMNGMPGLPIEYPLSAICPLIDEDKAAFGLLEVLVKLVNRTRIGTVLIAVVHEQVCHREPGDRREGVLGWLALDISASFYLFVLTYGCHYSCPLWVKSRPARRQPSQDRLGCGAGHHIRPRCRHHLA